jgi:hypothetical protein
MDHMLYDKLVETARRWMEMHNPAQKSVHRNKCAMPYPSKEKAQIVDWFDLYPFVALLTLTLVNDAISDACLENKILKLVRKIQKAEKIQIAYIGVVTRHWGHSRKHVHLLLCGMNRHGKTIQDCKPESFTKYWDSLSEVDFIDTKEDRERVVRYLVYRNMGSSYDMITPYNTKLLIKMIKNN